MRAWSRVAAVVGVIVGAIALVPVSNVLTQAGDHKAGQTLYESRCAKCHGTSGAGDGRLAQALSDRPLNWTAGEALGGMTDEQIFDVIKKGGPAVGKSSSMLAFPKLSDADVWGLIAHVRTLQP